DLRSARGCHTTNVGVVVAAVRRAASAEEACWRRRTADPQHVRMRAFDRLECCAQHLRVGCGADLSCGPLAVNVLLVPHFDAVGSERRHTTEEVGEILIILGWVRRKLLRVADNAQQYLEAA